MDYCNYLNNESSISYESLINRKNRELLDSNTKKEAFKSLLVENNIFIPYGKEELKEITSIIVEPIVKRAYNINTIKTVAVDNTEFTGNKLKVQILLKQIIEYISNDEINSSKCLIEYKKINTYITLSSEHRQNFKNKVSVNVENILSKKIDGRNIRIIIDLYIQGSKW